MRKRQIKAYATKVYVQVFPDSALSQKFDDGKETFLRKIRV